MPIIDDLTTEAVDSIWRSPDGQREIWKVSFDYQGKQVVANTFSKDIATVGWKGSVDSYERPGTNGKPSQTFVRQPKREDNYQDTSPRSSSAKPQGDQYTMYLAYAKDLLVALQNTSGYDKVNYDILLAEAIRGGDFLYESHNIGQAPAKTEPVVEDVVYTPTEDENYAENIDKVFGDSQPWKPQS